MDKQEILEKCRKENLLWDEGKIDARNKGRQWGVVGFIFLCVLVMTYNLLRGLDNQLPLAFFLGYLACEAFGQYGARRERVTFITAILATLGTLVALAAYVMETLP